MTFLYNLVVQYISNISKSSMLIKFELVFSTQTVHRQTFYKMNVVNTSRLNEYYQSNKQKKLILTTHQYLKKKDKIQHTRIVFGTEVYVGQI